MPEIRTPRLRLVPGTPAALRAELDSPRALAAVLGLEVPPSWPPELYDAGAVRWMLDRLETHPEDAAWGFYYVAEAARRADAADSAVGGAARGLVVGAGGYMGPPKAGGAVEIGYSIVPERRRRGYAREAVDGWLANAFADPRVTRVLAHTLPALAPSIAVLRSAGFAFAGPGGDAQEPAVVQYVLTRETYEGSGPARAPVRIGPA